MAPREVRRGVTLPPTDCNAGGIACVGLHKVMEANAVFWHPYEVMEVIAFWRLLMRPI